MATQEEIDQLVLLVGNEMLSEQQFGQIIDFVNGDMDLAAAQVWEVRAGRYHGLVNISESGSSRNMGDMYKNALEMAKFYRSKKVDGIVDPGQPEPVMASRTRRIVRE
jgi:hypothetical protein